jgi:hypothetical protein
VTILGALLAAATVVTAAGCKHGDYDGSFEGGFDGGPASGPTVSRVVQPGMTETVMSADSVFDVTFAAGTFVQAATIAITPAGERTLDTGLIVPIYVVTSDQTPAKFFQVSFHGMGVQTGGPDHALAASMSTAGADAGAGAASFAPLPIAGGPSGGGQSNGTFWGLTTTFGTFSLDDVTGVQSATFAENAASCTAQCCHVTNGQQLSGTSAGCYCPNNPDLACFLQKCGDLAGPAARCATLGGSNSGITVDCKPLGASNCPGPGCSGSFPGMCGTTGGGGVSNQTSCCITNDTGSCSIATCPGFSARCTAKTFCPGTTKCCVFETESYCAADCPAAQRACSTTADCVDAGVDAGGDGGVTCQAGNCPVGVCGAVPGACKP